MPRATETGSRPLRHLLLLPGLPVLVFLIAAALTGWVASTVRGDMAVQTNRLLALEQRAHTARLEANFSLLVESSRRLVANRINSQQEFRHRANAFLAQHPTLQGVELIRNVPHALRDIVEQQMSQEMNQFVQFRQWQQLMSNDPIAEQDQYLIVRWAYARSDSLDTGITPGLLASSVPHWRRELMAALTQQTVTITSVSNLENPGTHSRSLRIFVPTDSNELVSIAMEPEHWLGGLFGGHHNPQVRFAVHDLSHHNKSPLYRFLTEGDLADDRALRSEVAMGNRRWMISTFPSRALYDRANARSHQRIWSSGLGFGGATALLIAGLLLQRRRTLRQLRLGDDRYQRLNRSQQNLEVEKTILHQALDESGQRTRDLVGLAGGFIAELDDRNQVVFISEQVSEVLDLPPSALLGQPLEAWIEADGVGRFEATLKAARDEQAIERIDLSMLAAEQRLVEVTLRVKPVTDPINGCVGFRLSAVPRH